MVILSREPIWQARARDEVLQVFGQNKPDFDGMNRLKIVSFLFFSLFNIFTSKFL
jgi:hypothetical protein